MTDWRSASGRSRPPASRGTGASLRGGRSRPPASRGTGASLRGGFTLIEVLVALAIVSIALMAALRAAGQGTSNVDALRARLLAGWVAENVLAEQRARGDWPPLGIGRGTQRQGGIEFAWREEVIATPNARFRRVDLRVFAASGEGHQLSHLTGFVVDPPATAQ
ncbi:MAG: type II secretion system minor pseudopilin GspI [Lysobacter sp.]